HYVLVSRVIVYFTGAIFPGLPGFFDRPSQSLLLGFGLGCDLLLTVMGQMSRAPRRDPPARIGLWCLAAMLLIATGTLATSIAIFVTPGIGNGMPYLDAFLAIRIGAILVAAAAVAIARPAFFAFAGATALGGAIGKASMPFAF